MALLSVRFRVELIALAGSEYFAPFRLLA